MAKIALENCVNHNALVMYGYINALPVKEINVEEDIVAKVVTDANKNSKRAARGTRATVPSWCHGMCW